MKARKWRLLLLTALYSSILVQSCITIPRIDKKDTRNNQFSQELQDLMATKHPQKIDTVARKVSSDTTISEVDSVYYGSRLTDSPRMIWTSISGPLFTNIEGKFQSVAGNFHDPGGYYTTDSTIWITGGSDKLYGPTYIDTIHGKAWHDGEDDTVKWTPLYVIHDTVVRHELKIKTITIHDTIAKTVINNSEVNGLRTYLQTSRDSTNQFVLKYTEQKSTSRGRLIWIIVLALALLASGYFNIKSFKIF